MAKRLPRPEKRGFFWEIMKTEIKSFNPYVETQQAGIKNGHKKVCLTSIERGSMEISAFYSYEELLVRTGNLEESIPEFLKKEEIEIRLANDETLLQKHEKYTTSLIELRERGFDNYEPLIPFEVQTEVVLQPGINGKIDIIDDSKTLLS